MQTQYYNSILELIYKKNPLQKKKIGKHLSKRDKQFFDDAEQFAKNYIDYLNYQQIPLELAVDAYLKMCKDMVKSQIYFMKTGKYPMNRADSAFSEIYNNSKEMISYMIGLGMSQYLWETHYEMFLFFRNHLAKEGQRINNYLEVGPGHGLFLSYTLSQINRNANIMAVDISPFSLQISKSIINHFHPDNTVQFIEKNIFDFGEDKAFDFITMGEVLEHVEHPDELLNKLNRLISNDSKIYLSTCMNCPTVDHVYYFKCINEIYKMIDDSGLRVYDERILPVEDLPMEEIIKQKIAINYCTILIKK
jgi:2-polyprenyl-3-methyl-5-hydroxy-6-metoxy-1,4-benzoquinol methylase